MAIEQPQHEGVGADEGVPREVRPRLAEDAGDRRRLGDRRHVAVLARARRARGAAGRLRVDAALPLRVRHLLGQRADHRSAGAERMRRQRVAGRAQRRRLDVPAFGRPEARRRVHDAREPRFDRVRPEDRPLVALGDVEAAVGGGLGAETVRLDLVAHGARHAVARQRRAVGPAAVVDVDVPPAARTRRPGRCGPPSACGTRRTPAGSPRRARDDR